MDYNYNFYNNEITTLTTLQYKKDKIYLNIPEDSINLNLLHKLFSPEILSKIITRDNANHLMKFLPKKDANLIFNPQQLSNLLLNKTTKFNTPINDFYQKYLHRFFNENYQSKRELFQIENISDYIDKKNMIYIQLNNMLINIENNKNNLNDAKNINNNINSNNLTINPNIIRNTHSNNNNENLVTFDMHSELASSGYTSLDVDKDSKHSNSRKNSANMNGNGNSGERNNINNNNLKEQQNQKYGMNINNLNKINPKNKLLGSSNNSYIEHSDENDSFIDRNILKSERFKNVKKNKIQITIKPRTKEEIQNFRDQEKLRYEKPLQPWEYKLSNGNIAIVAPLFSSTKPLISKARGHELLKIERPPYITLLALVRDAASRLEDGVGTRLDICDLLKDSQYINENIADSKINSIVSGALDRLHYQKDPCVKYDSHNKLWIYLHRNRSLDYPGWKKIENIEDETNNSKKNNEENNNNTIIEDIDDNDNDNANEEKIIDKEKKKEKNKEIIDIRDEEEEQIKDDDEDEENINERNICKIKIDSSSDNQPNLIEMNEKIYNKKMIGKKRNKK